MGQHGNRMTLRKKRLFVAGLALQLFLVVTVSSRDTFWVLSKSKTIFPESCKRFWQQAEQIASMAQGQRLPASNPVRQILTGYLHLSGIEVEYELPRVSNPASVLRVAGLLDTIGRTRSEAFRQTMVKMLADAIWREHADATMIRAIFGSVILPSAPEFAHGKRESYEFLYAYDFSVSEKSAEQSTP